MDKELDFVKRAVKMNRYIPRTLRLLFGASVIVFMTGCMIPKEIPAERYDRALELVDQGTELLRAQRWQEALATFSLAEEVAPIAAAVDGQGCASMMLGDVEIAEQHFKDAYEMDEEYNSSVANLALLYDVTGRRDEALKLYEKFFKEHPDRSAPRNNYAAVLDDLGREQGEVVRELRKAAALQSNEIIEQNITQVLERGWADGKEGN